MQPSETPPAHSTPVAQPDRSTPPIADLRDRTDEMELIISGLTTFALIALPGWLLDRYVDFYPHLSVASAVGAEAGMVVVSGLCYALGLCFLVHLLTRAYWVGLIGLRTVFPAGIDWARTPGVGPLQRRFYRRHLPDLDSAIARADRLASTLFSIIGLIAIGVFWIGVVMIATLVTAGVIGSRYGVTNTAMVWAGLALMTVLGGLPLLTWLLDDVLGKRLPRLAALGGFQSLVFGLTRTYGLIYPQRLILPVQLTLQSNTRPLMFAALFAVGIIALLQMGRFNLDLLQSFTVTDEYRDFSSDDVRDGLRSSHYEDQRAHKDRLRLLPMIPSLRQDTGFVPLFIPFWPRRDQVVMDQLCSADEKGPDCFKRLWAIELEGKQVPLQDFLASERLDLGLRGLTGFISTAGLRPGLHTLTVTWNPEAEERDAAPHDRPTDARVRFNIPFLFAPGFELGLEDDVQAVTDTLDPGAEARPAPAVQPGSEQP
jgi:hypothetical protein